MPTAQKTATKRPKPRAAGPSEFAPGVSVGGWKDAVAFEGARFCVLDELPDEMPSATHVPIYDGTADRAIPKNLDDLVRAMAKERAKGNPVLVFCGHGVRRSPLAAAWYLRRTEGLTLQQAYERVRAVRPRIEEAREWIGDASNLEKA
jgi:protein-tyrosine phosphatase